MEIINSIIDFFGISQISESVTFVDLVSTFVKMGCAVWIVMFVIRCVFLIVDMPNRRLF